MLMSILVNLIDSFGMNSAGLAEVLLVRVRFCFFSFFLGQKLAGEEKKASLNYLNQTINYGAHRNIAFIWTRTWLGQQPGLNY